MDMKKAQKAKSGIGKRRVRAQNKGMDKSSYLKRRHKILRAAAKVFNEQGFEKTSMGAVADTIGISRATLYYYVASKEELFDELVLEAIENNVVEAEKIRTSDLPSIEKIRKMIIELMCSCETNFPLFYIFIRVHLEDVKASRSHWALNVRELNRRYTSILNLIIRDGINDGSFRPVASAQVATYGILGMICWTNRWFDPHESQESAEEIGTAFAEMVLNGIKA